MPSGRASAICSKKIQANKDRIENLKIEAQQAERQGDYGKVAEIRYGKIQEAEKEIAAFQEEYRLASANGSMIKEEVDAQDVAEVVSRWTGDSRDADAGLGA